MKKYTLVHVKALRFVGFDEIYFVEHDEEISIQEDHESLFSVAGHMWDYVGGWNDEELIWNINTYSSAEELWHNLGWECELTDVYDQGAGWITYAATDNQSQILL